MQREADGVGVRSRYERRARLGELTVGKSGAKRAHAATRPIARLEHDHVVASVYECVRGDQSSESGPNDDDLFWRAVGGKLRRRKRRIWEGVHAAGGAERVGFRPNITVANRSALDLAPVLSGIPRRGDPMDSPSHRDPSPAIQPPTVARGTSPLPPGYRQGIITAITVMLGFTLAFFRSGDSRRRVIGRTSRSQVHC